MRLVYIVYMYVRSEQVPRKFVERRPSRFVIRPPLQPSLNHVIAMDHTLPMCTFTSWKREGQIACGIA